MDDNEYRRLNQLHGPSRGLMMNSYCFQRTIPHSCGICNRPATISPNKFGSSADKVYHCAPCYNDYLRWLERFRRENPQWAAEEDHRRKYQGNTSAGHADFTNPPEKKKKGFWD